MSLTEPMITVDGGEVLVFDGILNMQDNPGQNNGNKTPPGQTIKPIKNPPVLEQPRVSEGQPNIPMQRLPARLLLNLDAWLQEGHRPRYRLEMRRPPR